jgi:L-alanine-DL-glutamate epimerase-like enolase superfamily enzyme
LWPSQQIINLLKKHNMLVLGSGLTDPDLSLAGAAHLFAWAGVTRPCALNGPQFLADRLSGDTLVPKADQLSVPTAPGLGLKLDIRAEAALRVVKEIS